MGHTPTGVVFLHRRPGSDNRKDRLVSVRHCAHVQNGLGLSRGDIEIAGILAHWPFWRDVFVRDMSLNDDLGGGGHGQVDCLPPHYLDRLVEMRAKDM